MTVYAPPPVVERFILDPAFICGIMGPFGSGKSVGSVMKLLRYAQLQAPAEDGIRYTRFAIVRNTNRMLDDTTIQTVHEWLPPGVAGTWLSTRRNFTLRFGDVHSEWWFRALDNPDDVKNLLSMEMTGAWLNEYREIHPDVLTNIISRVGRYRGLGKVPATWSGVIMDSNPPPLDGFYYNLFEREPTPEMQALAAKILAGTGRPFAGLHKQPSGLSPQAENVENLPDNYYELMVAANASRGDEWVKVHVHGEYGMLISGQPCYRGFRHATHVASEPLTPIPGRPLSLGMDFGLTPAVVVVQQNAHGQWMVLAEITTPKDQSMGTERFVQRKLMPELRRRFPDHSEYDLWADPAGTHRGQANEVRCFDVLRAAGFNPRKGPENLEPRIGAVQRVLDRMIDGLPGIIYDPSCKLLIAGKQGGYRFQEKRTASGELKQEPEKNEYSHPADAEQYVIGAYEGPAMKGRAARPWGRPRGGAVVRAPIHKWKVYG